MTRGDPENEELARLLAAGRRATLSPEALERIKAGALAAGPAPPMPGPPSGGLSGLRYWAAGGAGTIAVAAKSMSS